MGHPCLRFWTRSASGRDQRICRAILIAAPRCPWSLSNPISVRLRFHCLVLAALLFTHVPRDIHASLLGVLEQRMKGRVSEDSPREIFWNTSSSRLLRSRRLRWSCLGIYSRVSQVGVSARRAGGGLPPRTRHPLASASWRGQRTWGWSILGIPFYRAWGQRECPLTIGNPISRGTTQELNIFAKWF